MKLSQWILKLCCPTAEKERMELRQDIRRAQAHAEDLTRTVQAKQDERFARQVDALIGRRKKANGEQ